MSGGRVEYLRLTISSPTRREALNEAKRQAAAWFEVMSNCITASISEVIGKEEMVTVDGRVVHTSREAVIDTHVSHDWMTLTARSPDICTRCGDALNKEGPYGP